MSNVLNRFYSNVETIEDPGTLDAGDVMMVDKHFYIGLSERTNENGANQLITFLSEFIRFCAKPFIFSMIWFASS